VNSLSIALRRGAFLSLSAVLAVGLVACSSGGETDAPGGSEPAGGATIEVTGGAAEIVSADLAFNADTITAPAGQAFTITLVNNDTVPHNFSVYTEEGGEVIAQGEIINQGETDPVEIAALEPGEYYFVCDLHTEMNGTLVVEG
jgi:plastocyanin